MLDDELTVGQSSQRQSFGRRPLALAEYLAFACSTDDFLIRSLSAIRTEVDALLAMASAGKAPIASVLCGFGLAPTDKNPELEAAGLDSLDQLRLCSKLCETTRTRLDVATVMKARTVGGLMATVAGAAETTFGAMIAAIVKSVEPLADVPFVLVGNSFGAILALERARRLGRRPQALIVIG